jgi:hypothetical protein
MKKYLFLILAISAVTAFADENASDDNQPVFVKLTPEEKQLIERVIGVKSKREKVFDNFYNPSMLREHCDIFLNCEWEPDCRGEPVGGCRIQASYNCNEYPDCHEVLMFLKKYAEQVDKLNSEAKEFDQILVDKRRERIRKENEVKS